MTLNRVLWQSWHLELKCGCASHLLLVSWTGYGSRFVVSDKTAACFQRIMRVIITSTSGLHCISTIIEDPMALNDYLALVSEMNGGINSALSPFN